MKSPKEWMDRFMLSKDMDCERLFLEIQKDAIASTQTEHPRVTHPRPVQEPSAVHVVDVPQFPPWAAVPSAPPVPPNPLTEHSAGPPAAEAGAEHRGVPEPLNEQEWFERLVTLEKWRQVEAGRWLEHDDRLKALEAFQMAIETWRSKLAKPDAPPKSDGPPAPQRGQTIELKPGYSLRPEYAGYVLQAELRWDGSKWLVSW